jgi:hypothetical protein
MLERATRPRSLPPPAHNVVAADAASLWRVVERAAADPSVDLARLERLVTIYERLLARGAETAFNAALAKMQPKLPELDERGVITGRDGEVVATYATWEDTVAAIRPILARHGFGLTFKPGRSPKGVPTVTGVLRHSGGHNEEAQLELPADTTGDKNAVQAVGSTMSYGQRYVAKMLLNLTSRGDDDDGRAAGQSAAEFAAIAEINALADMPALLSWKSERRAMLGEMEPAVFQRVIGVYGARLRRVQARETQ